MLPINDYYDDVKFNVLKENNLLSFPLNHQKNDDKLVYFANDIYLDDYAIYHFFFSALANGKKTNYGNKVISNYDLNINNMFKMSVNFQVPDWAKGKVMYHIFVDRFNRNNSDKLEVMPRRTIHQKWDELPIIGPIQDGLWNIDYFGGNLKGIIDKLDYLKDLGVDILYLSPVCYSQSTTRYDTSDYEQVDPYAGSNEDLKRLCDLCHQKKMHVVLDAVFNHTGNDSKYFNEFHSFNTIGAFESDNSPYSDFYRKNNNNFDYWWGHKNMPECDGNSYHWQQYIYGEGGVIDKWFKLGIDGLRLDVADELTDYFIEGIRKTVKRNKPDGFIIGEVWELYTEKKDYYGNKRTYINSAHGMDTVMNYPLMHALMRYFKYGDCGILDRTINHIMYEYPDDTAFSLMNSTSTHDISRILNILGSNYYRNDEKEWCWKLIDEDQFHVASLKFDNYEKAKKLFKSYLSALTFMPGNLCIFYGDEVGLTGYGNLLNRRTYPWGKEDLELLEVVKKLIKFRKENKFIQEAGINIINNNPNYLMYERVKGDDKLLVAANRMDNSVNYNIPEEYKHSSKILTLNANNNHLGSYGTCVIKK